MRSKPKVLATNRGFTLIEMIVAIALFAVVSMSLTTTIVGQIRQGNVTRAIKEVDTIQAGVAAYVQQNGGTLTGATMSGLTAIKAIPAQLAAATGNPFGGSYTLASTTDDYTITLGSVPDYAQSAFEKAFANKADVTVDAVAKTVAIKFEE